MEISSVTSTTPIRPRAALPSDAGRDAPEGPSRATPARRPAPSHKAAPVAEPKPVEIERRSQNVEVEYDSASLTYVHKFVDAVSGLVLRQVPAAQVLDVVADVIQQMRRKEVNGD